MLDSQARYVHVAVNSVTDRQTDTEQLPKPSGACAEVNEWVSELSIAMHTKFSLEMLPCIVSAAIVIMMSTCN